MTHSIAEEILPRKATAVRPTPLDRLERWQVDSSAAFACRVRALELMELREAGGLGSFLGGAIELFPHQLHTAMRAVALDPVRWLLADEVGLGKTIEAGLILSALVRTARAQTVVVIAPRTLTVQWLGELYRKFHLMFAHLDDSRLTSTALEFGEDFNPFVAHRQSVVAVERLLRDPVLLEHAKTCQPDLVVVDEAHRLATKRTAGVLAKIVQRARHAILLTGTPVGSNPHGFHQLLRLLQPELYPRYEDFEATLQRGEARVPCASAVTREALGAFAERVPLAVDVGAPQPQVAADPRTEWLVQHARQARRAGEKSLVFVGDVRRLEALVTHFKRVLPGEFCVFHPDQRDDERDLALARFRASGVPLLLASEAGGEGRNFQFCDRIVCYDLPTDPLALEQRIGRLDRIDRVKPVEIVYFRCKDATPDLAALYERLEVFSRASAGIDAALAGVGDAVSTAVERGVPLPLDELWAEVESARTAHARNVPEVFYPDSYDPARASEVLAQVPTDLEPATERFCVEYAEQLGIDVVEKGGRARYYFEVGNFAEIDRLPAATRIQHYGSFDRAEALADPRLDFFSSGHELVEGLLSHVLDSGRGEAAVIELSCGRSGQGVLCACRRGVELILRAYDSEGRRRPDWIDDLRRALPRAATRGNRHRVPPPGLREQVDRVRRWLEADPLPGPLSAVALFRFS